jgi:hypothetical protein
MEIPKTTPPFFYRSTHAFSRTTLPFKLALFTIAPVTSFFVYRAQASYTYESKFKPYKAEVKKSKRRMF